MHRIAIVVLSLITCGVLAGNPPPCLAQATQVGVGSKAVAQDNKAKVRDVRSQNFFMHTDLSAAEAQELLQRLEKMLALISVYWGRPPAGVIETYVIRDLANFPEGAIDPDGRASVAGGGGVTRTQGTYRKGPNGSKIDLNMKAVCYCSADRGTPQHEAVHAYCGMAFGTTGPVWYSEGMAEMGQYWREKDFSVKIHDGVVQYLRENKIKSLNGIVNNAERTGDSWQNYAWRWALCHLLANNPNYAAKFRPLGLDILLERPNSFEQAYGDMAREITFEYKFFIANMSNGFRNDLVAIDWKKKFLAPAGTSGLTSTIDAQRGWQPTQAMLVADSTYEYTATGAWQTSKEAAKVTPAGDSDGLGRLMGVILYEDSTKEFALSEPFELGSSGSFTAPIGGKLLARCRDEWHQLTDNLGKVTLKIKLKK